MSDRLVALTLWPEWCPMFRTDLYGALAKDIENRPKSPPKSLRGEPGKPGPWVAMHAGKYIGGQSSTGNAGLEAVAYAAGRAGLDPTKIRGGYRIGSFDLTPDTIVTSAIVSVFRVVDVHAPGTNRRWKFRESFGIEVEYRHLAEPIRGVKGMQGWWTVPADIAARVREVAGV